MMRRVPMRGVDYNGHPGVSFYGNLPVAGPQGDRGATVRVDEDDGGLLHSATTVGTLGADGQVAGMYKGRVPGVAAEVEQWFASTFDPELVRRQAGAGPRAPILVTPIPEVDELVPGVDALASGLCDALGRTVRGVTAARLLKRLRLPARAGARVDAAAASSTLYADEGMLARVSATTVIVAVAVDTRADLSGAVRALAAASDAARRPKPLKLVAFREKPITYPVATQSQLEPSIRAMHSPASVHRALGRDARAAPATPSNSPQRAS